MRIDEQINKEEYLESKKSSKNDGGPEFEKQEWTEKTADMLGKDYVFAATKMKGWSKQKMKRWYKYVQKEADNPAALWWYLYNKHEKDKGG